MTLSNLLVQSLLFLTRTLQGILVCGFQLCLLSNEPQVQQLCHKVVIKGVPSPNSFHIRYPQPEGDKATAGNYQA